MATNFKIPKQTDLELAHALLEVVEDLSAIYSFQVWVNVPRIGAQQLPTSTKDLNPESDLGFLLSQNSCIASQLSLQSQGQHAVVVHRQSENHSDTISFPEEWVGSSRLPTDKQPQAFMSLVASARRHLKVHELEAAVSSDPTSAWSSYRNAQASVLKSLQKTAEQIIVDVANKNAEIDKQRSQRYAELEAQLRQELLNERQKVQNEHAQRVAELDLREKSQIDKEALFQTREARYVSRQKQDEQIKQIQAWLENWSLTTGTTRKRLPITAAYLGSLFLTGSLTIFATANNYTILHSAEDLAKIEWWQWVILSSKSFFPLAAFTTFMIYFIRWAGAWAKQHSEEEFRNRTRLIDIGRSGWLLEAVRDSQEKDGQIPTDLLKELSKNLFSDNYHHEGDIHPAAFSDLLLQGLTSLKLKTPEGSEIEATRARSRK